MVVVVVVVTPQDPAVTVAAGQEASKGHSAELTSEVVIWVNPTLS